MIILRESFFLSIIFSTIFFFTHFQNISIKRHSAQILFSKSYSFINHTIFVKIIIHTCYVFHESIEFFYNEILLLQSIFDVQSIEYSFLIDKTISLRCSLLNHICKNGYHVDTIQRDIQQQSTKSVVFAYNGWYAEFARGV